MRAIISFRRYHFAERFAGLDNEGNPCIREGKANSTLPISETKTRLRKIINPVEGETMAPSAAGAPPTKSYKSLWIEWRLNIRKVRAQIMNYVRLINGATNEKSRNLQCFQFYYKTNIETLEPKTFCNGFCTTQYSENSTYI